MTAPLTEKEDVEAELLLDRLIYGNCFWRVENGRKVRIAPWDVYLRPKWWVRFWYWLRSLFHV